MALDKALVATTNRLKIGKGNQRLRYDLKSNEATIQVVLDALKLTPVYNGFLVTASVREIYMQDFWATVTLYHTSLRFKLNGKKSYSKHGELQRHAQYLSIMDSTKAQQMALDEAFVATTNRLKIGKGNQRLSPDLKSNEATIQVVLDALKLTLVYTAFLVTASVPEIYMQELRATVTLHHTSLRFKLNGKTKKTKVKGLTMLTKAALSEADQLKLATKRSKKDFHILHANSLGDRVGKMSKVPDEQEQKDTSSELGSGLTSLAGSELGSELISFTGSELGLASYRLIKDYFPATCEEELCPFNFLLASCQVSSSELCLASYKLIEDYFLTNCE
nr:hypothetical protein [Tanacetum cinerariifolium]